MGLAKLHLCLKVVALWKIQTSTSRMRAVWYYTQTNTAVTVLYLQSTSTNKDGSFRLGKEFVDCTKLEMLRASRNSSFLSRQNINIRHHNVKHFVEKVCIFDLAQYLILTGQPQANHAANKCALCDKMMNDEPTRILDFCPSRLYWTYTVPLIDTTEIKDSSQFSSILDLYEELNLKILENCFSSFRSDPGVKDDLLYPTGSCIQALFL